MAAPAKAFTVITDARIDADSPADETLFEDVRDNDQHLEEWLGKNYTAAVDHDHDGVNSKANVIPAGTVGQTEIGASAVGQGELKTGGPGEVSTTLTHQDLVFAGGQYGFYPQLKSSTASSIKRMAVPYANWTVTGTYTNRAFFTTYQANITLGTDSGTMYAQQRYVTASGRIWWLYLLVDKNNGKIVSSWQCPEHPCWGNGDDPVQVPHPFPTGFDKSKYTLFVIQGPMRDKKCPVCDGEGFTLFDNGKVDIVKPCRACGATGKYGAYPDWLTAIEDAGKVDGRGILQTINEDYEPDDLNIPAWDDEPTVIGTGSENVFNDWLNKVKVPLLRQIVKKHKDIVHAGLRKR
jgi:hypothetical protein